MGMRAPTSGVITLDGVDISDWAVRRAPRGRHRLHPRGPAPARDAARRPALGEPHPRPPDPAAQLSGPPASTAGGARATPSGSSRSTTSARRAIDVTGGSLSGGNQQKLIVGREMSARPEGAPRRPPDPRRRRRRPGRHLGPHQAARRAGLAVLLISADLEELIGLSDTHPGDPPWSRSASTPPTVTPRELGASMTGAGSRSQRP